MAKNKKKDNKVWIIILIALALFIYGGNQGWFNSFNISGGNLFGLNQNEILSNSQGEVAETPQSNPSYNMITLSVFPTNICLGKTVTGTITSNLPRAQCYLQFKYGILPWTNVGYSFTLNENGGYTASTTANQIGTGKFRVSCSGILSNEVTVSVTDCSSSDSSSSSYTCGVTSYCFDGTCPTSYSCQEVTSVESTWCACVDSFGEVHPDWKEDGVNYNPNEESVNEDEEYAATFYCQQTAYNSGYDGGYLIYGDLTCSAYANNVCYPNSAGETNTLIYGGYTCCMWNCN